MNSSFVPYFAAGANFQQAQENQPSRFANDSTFQAPEAVPVGYLVSSDAAANKYLFLKPKYYDPSILTFAESTKQTVTPGELLTLGALPMANDYAGPVMVIDGDSDLPYCGSDCLATGGVADSLAAMVKENFPNVDEGHFEAYIQPDTGHGINLHYNSTGAYEVWLGWLGEKGLASL